MENLEFGEIADQLYERVFPVIVISCAVIGTLSFATQAYPQAVAAFLAIGLGIKTDGIIERRRDERAEHLAGLGWSRSRTPVQM